MKKINVKDVHDAVQHLYQKKIIFGQDFVHVRGSGGYDGVEEKINAFLNWLPVASTQEPSNKVPSIVPVQNHSNGRYVIQEGHHSAVAFAVMDKKGYYPHGIPTNTESFGEPQSEHIFIEENGFWYITVLKNELWQLFGSSIPKPPKYGRSRMTLDEYRKTVDSNSALGKFLAS